MRQIIDDLKEYCLEEISLEGALGCGLEELWIFVQDFFNQRFSYVEPLDIPAGLLKFETPEVPYADDYFKEFYWIRFMKSEELIFFIVKDKNEQSDLDSTIEKPKLYGMTLNDIKITYGDKFRMKATTNYKKRILFGAVDITQNIPPIAYNILQQIARKRNIGATQADLIKVNLPVVVKGTISINHYILGKFSDQTPACKEKEDEKLSSSVHVLSNGESESTMSKRRGRPKGSKNKNPPENTKKNTDVISRAIPNQRLKNAFGISNPFTNPDEGYRNEFRNAIIKTIKIEDEKWTEFVNITLDTINRKKFHQPTSIELIPWIQKITLNVVLQIGRKHLQNTTSQYSQPISGFTKPTIEELQSPLNIILPAYETMWRVLLYAILEIKVRKILNQKLQEKLKKKEKSEISTDNKDLDSSIEQFLKNPSHTTLKNNPLHFIVKETLRLYPATRHIHRKIDDDKYTIDLETIHRDPKSWKNPLLFNPERFKNHVSISSKVNPFIPFSMGKMKCIAADKFAPTLAAILIASVISSIEIMDIIDNKDEGIIDYNPDIPFKNDRKAFEKTLFTVISRS
ncbi:5142_t:CDS:2 [Diversispora eburnea]|uniref:5142_t:CDS:1 n=1 Tax=Diversispora eburnea TaxID=1213867 RepID=A0A9N9BK74_9GLOM|nr:5142_t:CDS:2 [Diversispora eburnea]